MNQYTIVIANIDNNGFVVSRCQSLCERLRTKVRCGFKRLQLVHINTQSYNLLLQLDSKRRKGCEVDYN